MRFRAKSSHSGGDHHNFLCGWHTDPFGGPTESISPPIPAPATQLSWNFSLRHSIYHSGVGNYPQNVYRPDNASKYRFTADGVARSSPRHGTATFSPIKEDPRYPNFIYGTWADNVAYAPDCDKNHGVRRESPLGPVCCGHAVQQTQRDTGRNFI